MHRTRELKKGEIVDQKGIGRYPLENPGSQRPKNISAINKRSYMAENQNFSDKSESGSSKKPDEAIEFEMTGNTKNLQAILEDIFKSVMKQLRDLLMNDKFFSIKEFNLSTKRRPADNRVRSTLPVGQDAAPAELRGEDRTDLRSNSMRGHQTKPHGGEPNEHSARQPHAPPVDDPSPQVATQRPITRPPIVRMYSIENNLFGFPKASPGTELHELSHLSSPQREPNTSQAFEARSIFDAAGKSNPTALGIFQTSFSSLSSPFGLKTGNTLPTNPATPDQNSKFERKKFRFIQLIPVPQDGGSSEASPESPGVSELKPEQAGADPAGTTSQARPSDRLIHSSQPNEAGVQRLPQPKRDEAARSFPEPDVLSELELMVDKTTLMEVVHRDKQAFQQFTKAIASVDRISQLDLLSNLACDNIGMLLELRTGNELLQELLRKQHPETITKLNSFFFSKLERFTSDEMTTKTLYCLAKVSPDFRSRLFAWYGHDLGKNLNSNPKVFLLNSIFKVSRSTDELSPIKAALNGYIHQSFSSSKIFKRFLISYSEYCEESELDRLFLGWNSMHEMLILLNDQYKALVLVSFLRRRHQGTTGLVLKLIRSQILDLFRTKFFKLLIIRLCNSNRDNDLLEKLFFALQKIPQTHLDEITRGATTLNFYLSLMMMTGGSRLAEHLVQLDGMMGDLAVVDRTVRLIREVKLSGTKKE